MTEPFIKIGESYINTKDIKQIDKYKDIYDNISYKVILRDNTILHTKSYDAITITRWLDVNSFK